MPLTGIAGSGPGGSVVALDVLSFELVESSAAPLKTVPLAGLCATADLNALSELLAKFADARHEISIEDAVVRAAAKALAAGLSNEALGVGIIALETPRGDLILAGVDETSASTQHAQRLAAQPAIPPEAPAELSLWIQPQVGIRTTILPLRPYRALRLAATLSLDRTEAELLLVFSTETTSETRAAALLAAIRDGLLAGLMSFA